MNEKQIDFVGRWALAFFAVFVLLVGWLGNSIRNEQFDAVFQTGMYLAFIVAVICGMLTAITYFSFKRPEVPRNERK